MMVSVNATTHLFDIFFFLMKYAGKEGSRWKSAPNEITELLPDGTNASRTKWAVTTDGSRRSMAG